MSSKFAFALGVFSLCLFSIPLFAGEDVIDTDQMMADLEKQLEVSKEKMEELRPALEEKSKELEKSINESVEKGYLEMEAMSNRLKEATAEVEQQLQSALNSDEAQKLHDYLEKIDQTTLEDIEKKLAEALTEFLALTEEQIAKLKPALEQGFEDLANMLAELAKEGEKNLEQFRKDYDQLNKDLRKNLEESLDDIQIEKLDRNKEELKQKISDDLFTA